MANDEVTSNGTPDAEAQGDSRDPSGFLSEIIGAPVTVKLNSGIIYKGMLASSPHSVIFACLALANTCQFILSSQLLCA